MWQDHPGGRGRWQDHDGGCCAPRWPSPSTLSCCRERFPMQCMGPEAVHMSCRVHPLLHQGPLPHASHPSPLATGAPVSARGRLRLPPLPGTGWRGRDHPAPAYWRHLHSRARRGRAGQPTGGRGWVPGEWRAVGFAAGARGLMTTLGGQGGGPGCLAVKGHNFHPRHVCAGALRQERGRRDGAQVYDRRHPAQVQDRLRAHCNWKRRPGQAGVVLLAAARADCRGCTAPVDFMPHLCPVLAGSCSTTSCCPTTAPSWWMRRTRGPSTQTSCWVRSVGKGRCRAVGVGIEGCEAGPGGTYV